MGKSSGDDRNRRGEHQQKNKLSVFSFHRSHDDTRCSSSDPMEASSSSLPIHLEIRSGSQRQKQEENPSPKPASGAQSLTPAGTSHSDLDFTTHKKRGGGILASDRDVYMPEAQFAAGCTLLLAAARGDIAMVERILLSSATSPHGAGAGKLTVNFRDYDRRTALHVAASEGHLHLVKYLVAHGAAINRSDRWGGSPLDDAHRHRQTDVARFLRSKGGKTGTTDLSTNFISAAAAGDVDEVKAFIDHCDIDVNLGDYDRRTALHVAAGRGHADIVEMLLKCGADPNAEDRWGGRPLDDALQCNEDSSVLRRCVAIIDKYKGRRGSGGTNRSAGTHSLVDRQSSAYLDYDSPSTPNTDPDLDIDFEEIEMIDRIGRGAFGDIYKCRWRGTLVAAKCIRSAKIARVWASKRRDRERRQSHLQNQRSFMMSKRSGGMSSVAAAAAATMGSGSGGGTGPAAVTVTGKEEALVDMKEKDDLPEKQDKETKENRAGYVASADSVHKATNAPFAMENNGLVPQVKVSTPENVPGISTVPTEEEDQLSLTTKEQALMDFRIEVAILKKLRHPNICMLLAYSTTEDYEVMVSELMKCSLLDIFKANSIHNTNMSKKQIVVYARQIAQGMNYLHTCKPPIIHRDLKPANLLIDYTGTLKISDFGLAKIRSDPTNSGNDEGMTQEEDTFIMTGETGTYRFMAPEVFRHEPYDERVDVYSYAMILYFLLQGSPPWQMLNGIAAAKAAAIEGRRPAIPRNWDGRLADLLQQCWDEIPGSRPRFEDILVSLNEYSSAVLGTKTDSVVVAPRDAGCACIII